MANKIKNRDKKSKLVHFTPDELKKMEKNAKKHGLDVKKYIEYLCTGKIVSFGAQKTLDELISEADQDTLKNEVADLKENNLALEHNLNLKTAHNKKLVAENEKLKAKNKKLRETPVNNTDGVISLPTLEDLKIVERRSELGLSIRKLAELSDVPKSVIGRIEADGYGQYKYVRQAHLTLLNQENKQP